MYRTKYKQQVHYVPCSVTPSFIMFFIIRLEDISETAVDAGVRFTIVKVDVDSRVAEGSTTSVTGDLKGRKVSFRQRRNTRDLPLACWKQWAEPP